MTDYTTKTCTRCKQTFPATTEYFNKSTSCRGGVSSRCKICHSIYGKSYYSSHKEQVKIRARVWAEEHPEHVAMVQRKKHLKRAYGLTIDDYDLLLTNQQGKCAICGVEQKGRNFVVDHDHKTGKVRGLLCDSCNVSIGGFKDSVYILKNAIAYLEKSK